GLGLEAWFERFLVTIDAPRVTLSDGVRVIPLGGPGSDGPANPHAWMSPFEAQVYIDNATRALSELVPEESEGFRARAALLRAELDAVAKEYAGAFSTLSKERRVLVTCEGAFSYLARDLGLDE